MGGRARVWGNGIKRIKKWKRKNVPVRDEIAACNFEQWKKRAGGRWRGSWVDEAAWENYYYCWKNVKGTEHKAHSEMKGEGGAWSKSSGVSLLLLPLDARHPGNGAHFMIITLILLCCSLVWCKELSYLRAGGMGSEGKYNFHRLARDNKAN